MIIFSPKKLLRYPQCVSSLADFGPGTRFQELIDDPKVNKKKVKRVLVCSGKIYYDLLAYQEKHSRTDIAIVRLEQLYPLPVGQLRDLIASYPKATPFVWVQEEPRNMGPWSYINRVITDIPLHRITRKPSPSPATGFYKQHNAEQAELVEEAFKV